MPANPFFIDPTMGRTGNELAGLASVLSENRERKALQAKQQRAAEQKQALDTQFGEVLRGGSQTDMIEFVGKNKQYSDAIKQTFGITNERTEEITRDMASSIMSASDPIRVAELLEQGGAQIAQLGGRPSFTLASAEKLRAGDPQELSRVKSVAAGMFPSIAGGGLTASQRERQALLNDLKSDDPNVRVSAERALALRGRPGQEQDLEALRASEAAKAGGKVEGKVEAESATAQTTAETQAFIKKAVRIAEKEATERGEVLTDLSRARAALPGLTDAVSQLKELATISTSTIGGRLFDTASKELGFGSTKGGDARAKFIAIINNQVLPLLKPTFGGSFTVQEGEALKATMGDPDASPDEKIAQLEAFMNQKMRDIESKESQLSSIGAPQIEQPVLPAEATAAGVATQSQPAQSVGRFSVRVK